MDIEMMTMDDEYVNDLAAVWYFLRLHISSHSSATTTDQMFNELIESGLKLKRILKSGGFTYLEPMNVFVDSDTFFDIWLDADWDIQASELYCGGD
jgi:hypothetical protein